MFSTLYKKGKESFRCLISLLLIAGVTAGPAMADETATLSVKSIPNVNIRMYGFIENDVINDSVQGFTEELDNPTVPKASTYAGSHHQTIFSIRNSRLGFDVSMPKSDSGIDTEGIFEMDFLGNQPTYENGSTSTAAQRDLFNNPTVRVRHAYANINYEDWNAKLGQTWSLMGWQPYYFPSEAIVQPAVGQLYRRFAQARITNTQKLLSDEWTLESAIDAAKPAEINSGVPVGQAGLRFASTKYKAVSGIGSGTPMVGASVALSGEIIPIRTNTAGNSNGSAIAADLLIPIIPSTDGKDPSNNLSLTGEYTNGRGYGGLELAGATSGIPGVTAAQSGGSGSIDSGLAGISSSGNLDLIHFETYRANLTYVWPWGGHWANSAGYAETQGLNIGDYTASTGYIPRYQYYYGNVMFLPLNWLRFALEWAQIKNVYNDANNRFAYDNRIQFTTYLTF